MIVYSATKAQFCETVRENRIGQTILDAFRQHLGHNPSPSEAQAFQNSLNFVGNMLQAPSIPADAGVAVEYKIPQSSKRIDFIVTGFNEEDKPVAIVIELKQWTDVETTPKDAIVRTWVGGAEREVLHPSYQAWSYAQFMTDFNEFVDHHQVRLHPCAYLHNCHDETGVRSPFYWEHLGRAPVFLGDESKNLENFIAIHVRKGDRGDLLYKLDKGKIRPSKSLTDHLGSLLKGNKEFVMIDEQKLVYEAAIYLSTSATTTNRKVLIVRGGPGTGKSVVAVNLLVELSSRGKLVQYVTRNAAPRAVYRSKLAGTIKRTRIDNLFKNSGFYQTCKAGELDVLVVDEAHRLTEKSGLYMNEGENQIKEVIEASKLTVFFLDEDQRVTINDIGTGDEIVRWADHFNAEVSELELPSQFRCNGESGYISFLDQLLQIRPTANTNLEGINYDFQVMRNPSELREAIFQKNDQGLRSRLVAGYCWNWVSKNKPNLNDICFGEYGFAMPWNLSVDGSLWLLTEGSENQVGCIHTCQGLELDYVGVIIGPDFKVRRGVVETNAGGRARTDRSLRGIKKMIEEDPQQALSVADRVIKNTYRTLMTRGMKGCYIWASDFETNEWLRDCI
ncbi:MAG: DUF2075 domain-containing protein [Planctomycetota bacterium]|nr:MAG: DUF2075 domain-containing protein [Planctomycetota bacterium]